MAKIAQASIRYYPDNQQYQASVMRADGSQTVGTCKPKNSCFLLRWTSMELGEHMEALFRRLDREGCKEVKRHNVVTYLPVAA